MRLLLAVTFFSVLSNAPAAGAAPSRGGKTIPANVMAALTARFPQAAIDKWSKEKEDGKEVYDIEFRQGGRKFEADVFADGTLHNWEQQIEQSGLPQAVLQTISKQFPNARLKEIMAVTDVARGRDQLQGYELIVERARKRDVEITIAPDGRILEGPGKPK